MVKLVDCSGKKMLVERNMYNMRSSVTDPDSQRLGPQRRQFTGRHYPLVVWIRRDDRDLTLVDSVPDFKGDPISILLRCLTYDENHIFGVSQPHLEGRFERCSLARITHSSSLIMAVSESKIVIRPYVPRFQQVIVFDSDLSGSLVLLA